MPSLNSLLFKIYKIAKTALNQVFLSLFGMAFSCKHSFSCSQYTSQKIRAHGPILGTFMGMKRVLSCW